MTNESNIGLVQNFGRVIRHLQNEGMGLTQIAKMIGYTSTSQLNNSLEEKSMLSTKAILTMIERLNVNPVYLFLGKGDMFIKEEYETEFSKLYNEFNSLHNRYDESIEIIKKLKEKNIILEKMIRNLLADTAEFMKSVTEIDESTVDQKEE